VVDVARDPRWPRFISTAIAEGATWQDGEALDGFADPAGAMQYLCIGSDELDRLVASGELHEFRPTSRMRRYQAQQLAAIAKARATPPEPEPSAEPAPHVALYGEKPQHLYLIEVVGHCVKVGITTRPLERLKNHEAAARNYGRRVGRVWVSIFHKEACRNEREIKCGSSSEYLRRRKFDDVLEQALALSFTRVVGEVDGSAEREAIARLRELPAKI
jgi:predicted GIY-YIG superfamily endonuclease